MGKWFARFLSESGHSVWISGRRSAPLRKASRELHIPMLPYGERCDWVDSIVLAIPPDRVQGAVIEYDDLISRDCLLVDISSVKAPVIDFLRSQQRPFLSIHPFFGQGAVSLKGMNVAVVYPPRPSGRSREILRCLKVAGARIVRCTPEIHDLAVSYTLALPHLLGAIYGSMLRNSELGPRSLADLGGTSFRTMYSLAKSIGSESPLVYASIQLAPPSYPRTLKRALLLLRKMQEELSIGERRAFLRLVEDCSELPPLSGIKPVGSDTKRLCQRKSFKV